MTEKSFDSIELALGYILGKLEELERLLIQLQYKQHNCQCSCNTFPKYKDYNNYWDYSYTVSNAIPKLDLE